MQDDPCLVLKENLKMSEFYVSLEIKSVGATKELMLDALICSSKS